MLLPPYMQNCTFICTYSTNQQTMEKESGQTIICFTPPYGHHLAIYKIMTVYHLSGNRNRRRKRDRSVRSSTCILWAEETTRKACGVMLFSALFSAAFFTVLFQSITRQEKAGEVSHTEPNTPPSFQPQRMLSVQELADQETANYYCPKSLLLLNAFIEIHLLFVLETLTFDFFS